MTVEHNLELFFDRSAHNCAGFPTSPAASNQGVSNSLFTLCSCLGAAVCHAYLNGVCLCGLLLGLGLIAVAPVYAASDDLGPKMMLAAAVVLADEAFDVGQIEIIGPDEARSSHGFTFRRLAPCVYGMSEGQGEDANVEIVDFGSLTGRVLQRPASGGERLALEGRSQRTRCFSIAGSRGCQAFVELQPLGMAGERQALDDLGFMQRNGCASKQAGDPY